VKKLPVAGCAVWTLLAAGCSRYADFTLPPPPGAPVEVSFRWEALPEPVLSRGAPGTWDAVDVLNPSVVRQGGLLYNFYSGFDGRAWHTGLATSTDGVRWVKQGRVLSPDRAAWEGDYIAANGSALFVDGRFLYWYQAGRPARIGLATSADGRRWSKLSQPVLGCGPRASFDERGVADPFVVRAGAYYYLFYLGQDRARRQRLGLARSSDGVGWWKLRSNPILEPGPAGAFDEKGLGEPAVWAAYGHYWMLYTGRDRAENRRLGLARSRDGVRWQRVSESAVFAGSAAWNSKVVCDPSVDAAGPPWRVWFGGGDVARPDENLHGQIGLAVLSPVTAFRAATVRERWRHVYQQAAEGAK
jgi:predicted GH43/DUF377 family glycosyl hydrolase